MNIQVTVDDDNCKVIKAENNGVNITLKKYPNGGGRIFRNDNRQKSGNSYNIVDFKATNVYCEADVREFCTENNVPWNIGRAVCNKL